MRRSCLVQLTLLVILAATVATGIRRYLLPTVAPTDKPPATSRSEELSAGTRAVSREPLSVSLAAIAGATRVAKGIEGLALGLVRPLMVDLPPSQGLAIHGTYLFVGAHDPDVRAALLYKLHRDTQTLVQMRVIAYGSLSVIGGLHGGQEFVWAALREEGGERGALLGIDPLQLDIVKRFEIEQPVATIAEGPDGRLYSTDLGGQWLCKWSQDGQTLGCLPLANGARYTDMDVVNGSLVCAGRDSDGGVLDVYDLQSLTLLVRHRADARFQDRALVSGAGFAYANGTFYFLPISGRYPMLLAYGLAGGALEDYVPSVRR